MVDTASEMTFAWEPQPEAAALVGDLIRDARRTNPQIDQFADRLLAEAGTRLVDQTDHFVLPENDSVASRLESVGFLEHKEHGGSTWLHPGGMFPGIRVEPNAGRRLALKVDSLVDFLRILEVDARVPIEGAPLASFRRACASSESDTQFWAVERHGYRGFAVEPFSAREAEAVLHYAERFKRRPRHFASDSEGFDHAEQLIRESNEMISVDRTCDLFFQAERENWQRRNRAGQVQKARQDRLGIGWANHDHHTFRSSRECFHRLVGALELLGFGCRERFYAGREAGWGAQVLCQPTCGLLVFADVDLSPDEVADDFAHEPLAPQERLATIGLWCKLHGEAFLGAGLHHLECQYDFAAARDQLRREGIETMAPFTDFPHLKQAFTEGEVWMIAPERIDTALSAGWITPEEADDFRNHGARGSHLEILERNDGYQGFNQTGISDIIRKTDPRLATRVAEGL